MPPTTRQTARRPGPLQELPLARFVHPEPKVVSNPFKTTPPKRPRSPGTPIGLLSPAKKRILREEKLFAPEPVKAPTQGSSLDSKSKSVGTPTLYRKLDFGSPSSSSSTRSTQGAVAVETRVTRQTRQSAATNRKPTQSSDVPSHGRVTSNPTRTETRTEDPALTAVPFMIPRDIPELSDRQSVHYPGFDIHIDTHVELASTRRRVLPDLTLQTDLDSTKENIAPRKRAKKSSLGPADLQGIDGKAKSNISPKLPVGRSPGLTPKQSHFTRLSSNVLTPGRTPPVSRNAKLEWRRAMEEEADIPDDETSEETCDGEY